jgi:prophage maintenance system killer protein
VLASFVLVELNGFEVVTTNERIVQVVLDLLEHRLSFDDLAHEFERWLRPLE